MRGEAVKTINKRVDLGFESGGVGGGIGVFGGEDAVNESDDGGLFFQRDVGDGELFPVVGIEVNVAAAIGAEKVAGNGGVHHAKQILHQETVAVCLQVLTAGQIRARWCFAFIARNFFQ